MWTKILSVASVVWGLLKGSSVEDIVQGQLRGIIAQLAKNKLTEGQKANLQTAWLEAGRLLYQGNDAATEHLTALAALKVFALFGTLPPETVNKIVAAAQAPQASTV